MEIISGMKGSARGSVAQKDTALQMGSGSLPVYATPCMAALMEEAACDAVKGALSPDKTTVGIELSLKHQAATPVGMEVWAEAEITSAVKNVITYKITAYDKAGVIGVADHKRAIITSERFLSKTYAKL